MIALGLVALWAQAAPLATERLPGFQIDLPAGDSREAETTDYRSGRLLVRTNDQLFVRVAWEPGDSVDDKDTARMAEALAIALGKKVTRFERDGTVKVPGLPTGSWKMRMGDGLTFWMATVICGGRSITLTTAGKRPGIEALHHQVARSLRCQPDPTKERQLGDVALVADLPPSWRRVKQSPTQLILTDGLYLLFAVNLGAKLKDDVLAKMMPDVVGPDMRVSQRQGSDWSVTATTDPTTGWLTVLRCLDGDQTVLLMSLVDGKAGKAQTAREILRKARCRRPGESPQQWQAADQ